MKKSKIINLICSLTLAAVIVLIVLLIIAMNSMGTTRLVISSGSAQTVYDGNTLTENVWKLESGELKKGHTLNVKVTGSQKNVGTSQNMFHVTITDSVGADVTSDYVIESIYGSLTVVPKEITISTSSASKVYDGEPLTSEGWSYSPDNALVPGHTLEVELSGSITEIGFTQNKAASVVIRDEKGKEVTYNYDVNVDAGTLIVYDPNGGGGEGPGGPADVGDIPVFGGDFGNVPDEPFDCFSVAASEDGTMYFKLQSFGEYTGSEWLDAEASDVKIYGEYSADYLPSLALGSAYINVRIEPLVDIYPLPYYISFNTRTYDFQTSDVKYSGNSNVIYSVDANKYNYGPLPSLPTDYIDVELAYRRYVYATYLNVDAETAEYMKKIIEAEGFAGNDMATLLAVAKYIQSSAKYNLEYDRALDEEPNVAIAFLDKYKEGICQHYASAATLLFRTMGIPARYTVGFVTETVADEWVVVTSESAHAWVEVYIDGMGWVQLEVTGGVSGGIPGDGDEDGPAPGTIEIEIAPVDVEKKFDGNPLSAPAEIVGFEDFEAAGYTYIALINGTRSVPGKTASEIEKIQIFDPDGNDVTGKFHITKKTGTIHIYLEIITIWSSGASKVYDGSAIRTDISLVSISGKFTRDYVSAELLSGAYTGEYGTVRLVVNTPSELTNVGTVAAGFKAEVYDTLNNLITDNYKIKKECGALTVVSRQITVEAGSAERYYTGEPLTSDEYKIHGALADGDYVKECVTEGSQLVAGRSENIVKKIVIFNENGEDVTSNYSIELAIGILRVLSGES